MTDNGKYENADTRPHTGDSVRVHAEETTRLKSDVAGTVQGTHRAATDNRDRVKVKYGPKAGVHPFDLDAVTLLEATDNRFDDFEPGVVEEWEPPTIRYGVYIPPGPEGALVTKVNEDRVQLSRKPSTNDKRVIREMESHGWEFDFKRDSDTAKPHGMLFFKPAENTTNST